MTNMILPQKWNRPLRYGIAPITVALALFCRMALNPFLQGESPFMYFFLAIIVSGWLGGLGPGLTATVLSMLAVDYFYLPPIGSVLSGDPKEIIQALSFLILGAVVSVIVARLRWERRRAEQATTEARESETEARRAQEALRLSEERLRATFDNAALGIVETDQQDRFLAVNDRLCKILGYRREELLGLSVHDLTAPEDRPGSDALNARLHEGDIQRLDYEKRYLRQDGSPLWVHLTVTSVRDGAGRYRYSIGTIEDISQRKAAEEQLRLQAMALDAAANGIIITDPAGTILWSNPAFATLTGYDTREVIGSNPRLMKSGKQDQAFYHAMWETIGRGEVWHGELVNRRKDGSFYTEEMSISPVMDERGGISHYIAIRQDISERKRMEARLKDTERRLTDIIEFLPDATFALDNAGRIIAWNKAMENLTGAPAAEVLGRGDHEYTYRLYGVRIPCLADTVLRGDKSVAPFSNIIQENDTLRGETYIPRLKPGGVWLSIKVAPIYDAQGKIVGVIDSCRDITENKRAEAVLAEQHQLVAEANVALSKADQRKDEFLAMLAHELRNPLAPILNAVHILKLSCDGICSKSNQAGRQREIIDRQVAHMARLLDDLLDVSRITRGKIRLSRERLDLRLIAERAIESMRSQLDERELILEHQASALPLPVEGDPTRLEQVLRNLLHNAIKYTEPGGCISMLVGLEHETDLGWRAVVRLRDSGIGIAPEVLPRVFELFTQADQSLAHAQGGLGIGLTMVQRLVELHGGRVEARSAGLGQGSEFIVRLPLIEMLEENVLETPTPVAAPAPLAQGCSCRVLVVDDNQDAAACLGDLLRIWGYEVQETYDGEQALAAARDWLPEVILLDIGLPQMDGYEVARHLRKEPITAGAYIVAVTGYGAEEDRRRAMEAGFDYHLTKPVEVETLQRLLHDRHAA